ncbi:MAG: hypothetical protein WBV11_14615 [Salegentibacter sp.]
MRSLLVILSVFLFFSCKQEKPEEISAAKEVDSSAFTKTIQAPDEEVNLLPEAREQASQWLAYITAQNEIDNLENATLNQVIESAKPLNQIMQSLQRTVPDTLRTKPVEARINVLVTKAHVLEQFATQRDPDPEKIAAVAREIPVEFNNFKVQINEIFLKTLEDFEKELDRLEKENKNTESQDSLPPPRR